MSDAPRSAAPAAAPPRTAAVRFAAATLTGLFFFLLPLRVGGAWTIPFDLLVSAIRDGAPTLVRFTVLALITISALLTLGAAAQRALGRTWPVDLSPFATGWVFTAIRLAGAAVAVMVVSGTGPAALLDEGVGPMIFDSVVVAVAVIVPIGAVFVTLLVSYGGLEFIGTLARPVMRPLFRVPGRGALDALASFVGSYSIGLYVTNRMYLEGRYSARESATIATCFSSVSLGFFAVVAATLDLMPYFPLIVGSVLGLSVVLAAVLVRIPPLSRKPDTYAAEPRPEPEPEGPLVRTAVRRAVERAGASRGVARECATGFAEGVRLALVILPTILAVGTAAVLAAQHTPVFDWLGRPLEPVIALLGIPDADVVAPASLVGLSEMFLPALFATGAAVEAKFFVAVLSLTQLLFFSATIPLLLELDVPVRLRDCLALFVLRTTLSIPLIALIVHLVF
ncbi:YjiH family protein [Nocardiopsis halophila]|uniref:YjiH family protein n=1 Tax=Nocardiopsis halophila TaxID=141692 RepID=UPI0003498897|nr:YjiH family protein [Nocardiopsis halophila]